MKEVTVQFYTSEWDASSIAKLIGTRKVARVYAQNAAKYRDFEAEDIAEELTRVHGYPVPRLDAIGDDGASQVTITVSIADSDVEVFKAECQLHMDDQAIQDVEVADAQENTNAKE